MGNFFSFVARGRLVAAGFTSNRDSHQNTSFRHKINPFRQSPPRNGVPVFFKPPTHRGICVEGTLTAVVGSSFATDATCAASHDNTQPKNVSGESMLAFGRDGIIVKADLGLIGLPATLTLFGGKKMSIRFERQPHHCTYTNEDVILLVEFNTPEGLSVDADLAWIKGKEECLNRKTCGDTCPGEAKVLNKL